eukprot:scaffold1152_cov237-Chaetoceros_neogracile.AAC.1
MVVKKKKPAPIPLKVLVKCSWSGARIPTPSTLSTSSTLSQVITSISSSLPPLITKPLGEWNEPQPFIVYMRTNVLKRDWDITKISDFCDGGSILLTLNLPKDDGREAVVAEQPVASSTTISNDSPEPMDIDNGTIMLNPKTPKEAMTVILISNFDQESKECLLTIIKMVDNLLSKSDAKFRSIRISNKSIEKKITSKIGGLDLLLALGFEYDSSRKVRFDFDNSNNIADMDTEQSEMLVLRPENEDRELLVEARGQLCEVLTKELNAENIPSVPSAKSNPTVSTGNEVKNTSFDPFRSQSYNIQAAAAGAPNSSSMTPDGSSGKSTTERKLEILQQKQQKLEQSIQSLGDRGITAFLPGDTGSIVVLNSPGDIMLDSKGDSSLLAGLAKKKMDERKQLEEGGFRTKSMRLVPAAKVHVSWKSGPMQGSPGFYLQPRFFQSSTSTKIGTTAFPDSIGLEDTHNVQKNGMQSVQGGADDKVSKEEELIQRMLGKRKGLGLGFGKKKGLSVESGSEDITDKPESKNKGSASKPKWFKG